MIDFESINFNKWFNTQSLLSDEEVSKKKINEAKKIRKILQQKIYDYTSWFMCELNLIKWWTESPVECFMDKQILSYEDWHNKYPTISNLYSNSI